MEIKNLLYISSLALLVWSCKEDVAVNPITPTPGKEVVFGVSLPKDNQTRTVYGDETNGVFPIYWSNGDQIRIMSPNQAVTDAVYKVNASGAENTAQSIDKVTAAGIQWGTEATANFFSVYPNNRVQKVDAASKTITMRLSHIQNDTIDMAKNASVAQADMNDAFLYAQKFDAPNGSEVNLPFKPLATAIRFTLQGPSGTTGDEIKQDEVLITNVVINAPAGVAIAGDFDVVFQNNDAAPVITPAAVNEAGDAYNRVEIMAPYKDGPGYLTLKKGESMELNAFIIPQPGLEINDQWSITVNTPTASFTKKLSGASDGKTNKLEPGQIHKLGDLPALDIPAKDVTYDPSNWMVNIPRNTYLSEISLPGSWNSMNPDFQSVTDLTKQYAAGVRAFHLDTRWSYSLANGLDALAIANGKSTSNISSKIISNCETSGKAMNSISATTFASALTTITNQVKSDEYMVLLCTFAQGSATKKGTTWMQAISDACASNAKVYDASSINQNTVVGDVLGSVIVIVNCEGEVPNIPNSKCLFVDAPLTLTESGFTSATSAVKGLYSANKKYTNIGLYQTQAQVSANLDTEGGYNSENRGWAPSLYLRKKVANGILDWSLNNYGLTGYAHDQWIYLGLGGYEVYSGTDDAIKNSYTAVAESLNDWINKRVSLMNSRPTGEQTRYYPVGIVLMNYVTNATYGQPVVNNILQLNSKYQKAYDPKWEGIVDQTKAVQSVSPKHASGFKVNSDSWTVF